MAEGVPSVGAHATRKRAPVQISPEVAVKLATWPDQSAEIPLRAKLSNYDCIFGMSARLWSSCGLADEVIAYSPRPKRWSPTEMVAPGRPVLRMSMERMGGGSKLSNRIVRY